MRNARRSETEIAELALFYGKKNIDVSTQSKDTLYSSEEEMMDYSFVTELESLGINVVFAEPGMQDVLSEVLEKNSLLNMNV